MVWAVYGGGRKLDYFRVKQVVILFAGLADAAHRAADQYCHAESYQDGGQVIAEARQMEQNVMYSRDPHRKPPHHIKKRDSQVRFPAAAEGTLPG